MMGKKANDGQSGGVDISGSVGNVGGDIVGGNKETVGGNKVVTFDGIFGPLTDVIRAAPPEVRKEAETKLAELKQEAAKGKDASDGVVAQLVNGLVGLVPAAASAVVSAFATPILGGIAGPVTKMVLDKIQGK